MLAVGRVTHERRHVGPAPGEGQALRCRPHLGADRRGLFWPGACQRALSKHAALALFRHDFWRGDGVDARLVALVQRLRPGYQTAVISNATGNLRAVLEHYRLLALFDVVVGSAEEGLMKPHPAIYERALGLLGRTAGETIFIDDAPANVAGALAVGMNAIRFTPDLDLEAELRRYGVVPAP